MPAYSVLLPLMPVRPEHVLPYAALVQHHRVAHRLWLGQTMSLEPHQLLAYAAATGFRIPVGIGVTLMPFRHPLEAALQARSLAITMGHPVVAGFGPGATSLQRDMHGAPYGSPLTASREYLTLVRAMVNGETVEQDGDYVTFHGGLPRLPAPPVEVGLGVLRPGMAKLAGELADVAITWLTPPSYLAEQILPSLREGAAAAGRAVPRLVAMVPVALRLANRDPVELVLASNRPHLELPHYVDMLRLAGVGVDPGDPAAGAQALIDSGAFCYGDPSDVVKQLDAYATAGVDEVVVNATGTCLRYGSRNTLTDVVTLLDEIGQTRD